MTEIQEHWKSFAEEYPEPYRNIKVKTDGELLETKTYLHNGKLMIEFKDGNDFFIGMSPALFDEETQWTYC